MSETRVVITFHGTTEAMAWESACKKHGLPGRIIPLPVQISAECGLAWLIRPGEKDELVRRALELRLNYQDVVELK